MREKIFLIFILLLFLTAFVILGMKQESLYSVADQDFVSAGFVNPEQNEDWQFVISHKASSERKITLIYEFSNGEDQEEQIMLSPKEERSFTPASVPERILIQYENSEKQTEQIILYKK